MALWLSLGTPSQAQSEPPGGKGKVEAVSWCTPVKGTHILKLCGRSTLRYEFSALLGEPLAHFGLEWQLVSLEVRGDGRNDLGVGETLYAGTPAFQSIFKGSEKRIQLMGQGVAELRTGLSEAAWGVDFDTGAPTVAGQGSWQVAGSPDWSKALYQRTDCMGLARYGRNFVPPDQAKDIWRSGTMRLNGYQGCLGEQQGYEVSNLDAAEAAVTRYCKAHPGKGLILCPDAEPQPEEAAAGGASKRGGASKTAGPDRDYLDGSGSGGAKAVGKPGGNAADWLDAGADASKIAQIESQLVARHRDQAQAQCTQEMQQIEACIERQCGATGLPAGVTAQQCDAIPAAPVKAFSLSLCSSSMSSEECRAATEARSKQADAAHRQRFDAWWTQWGTRSEQCKPYLAKRAETKACLAAQATACNPQRRSQAGCVSEKMAQAPGKEEAKRLYDSRVQERSKTGGSKSYLD